MADYTRLAEIPCQTHYQARQPGGAVVQYEASSACASCHGTGKLLWELAQLTENPMHFSAETMDSLRHDALECGLIRLGYEIMFTGGTALLGPEPAVRKGWIAIDNPDHHAALVEAAEHALIGGA